MKGTILSFIIIINQPFLFEAVEVACSTTEGCLNALNQGQPFQEPDQLSYDLPRWCIHMTVDVGEVNYGWLTLKRRMYNGKIVGPTWTVKRSDVITVDLRNRLSKEGSGQSLSNTTNLHTHGLHISSKDPQDNVLRSVNPGENYQYVYEIHEENAVGTYWYHAHVHQSTMLQVHSGLSGILIVQDEASEMPAELERASCPNNCDKDIQMIFQPILQYTGERRGFGKLQDQILDATRSQHDGFTINGGQGLRAWLDDNMNFITTNGQLQPVLGMTTGQMYRFRMVNAGGDADLELFITEAGTHNVTSACDIREIALDGVYLDQPREMHDGQSYLTPGGRVDWLVRCNLDGKYEVRSFPFDKQRFSIGEMTRYDGLLVTLEVSGVAVDPPQPFPDTLPARPSFLSDLRNVPPSQVGGRFVVELNPTFQLNRESWSVGNYYRYKMEVDTIQEWHLVNTETKEAHPIHLHVNHFQIISYNNYTGGYGLHSADDWTLYDINDLGTPCRYQRSRSTAEEVHDGTSQTDVLEFWGHDRRFAEDKGDTLGYSRLGVWRDVVTLPPLSNITIRFIPHQHVGDSIIHCHILDHEDLGMMMNTQIVAKDESLEANVTSGDAYPGTCRACDRYPFDNPRRLCDDATKPAVSLFCFAVSFIVNCY